MSDETQGIKSKTERAREASLAWRHRNIERARRKNREYAYLKRSKDKEGYNEYMRSWRTQTPKTKIKTLITVAKGRAKIIGVDFNLTIDDLPPPTHCPLLGIEINYAAQGRGGRDNSPSIDRIDPSLGYVPGNVWIISWRANRIKNNSTLEELKKIVNNLSQKMDHAKGT